MELLSDMLLLMQLPLLASFVLRYSIRDLDSYSKSIKYMLSEK